MKLRTKGSSPTIKNPPKNGSLLTGLRLTTTDDDQHE